VCQEENEIAGDHQIMRERLPLMRLCLHPFQRIPIVDMSYQQATYLFPLHPRIEYTIICREQACRRIFQ
jgi:hypothetical protein